ncbi:MULTISPECIES: tol-pal system YbgF family protein [unclassified Aureispira]|uniref:tetratricopeptide repeat protein n=1 Tax=unclassified Aureispira TaxID=2649989 RepID=UPI0006983C9D|nr:MULTISPECIES: tetratricopeptide repeat protein [unclassified Aureispira]WMX16384.1 tetratricopeptide repeat protein [Aureispira sp. CCB-E]
MKKITKTSNKVIKFGRFRWVAAGAIFALIAGLCFINPSNGEQVFDDNFMAYEDNISAELDLMLSTRSAGDDEAHASLRMIREGMEHYNNKEYDKAIPIFEEYLEKNQDASDYNQIKFYLAVSFLGQNETEKSAKMFEELAQLAEPEIQEDSKWYLSLAYARIGKTAEAKAQLEELASSEKYGSKAAKILNPSKTKVAFR